MGVVVTVGLTAAVGAEDWREEVPSDMDGGTTWREHVRYRQS